MLHRQDARVNCSIATLPSKSNSELRTNAFERVPTQIRTRVNFVCVTLSEKSGKYSKLGRKNLLRKNVT